MTTTAEIKSVGSPTPYIPAVDSSVKCNILQTVETGSVDVQTDSCRLPVPLGDNALDDLGFAHGNYNPNYFPFRGHHNILVASKSH